MLRVIEYFAKSFSVIGHGTIRQIAYEFLLATNLPFHSNLDLTCIISDVKGDIGRQPRMYHVTAVFNATVRVFQEQCHGVW